MAVVKKFRKAILKEAIKCPPQSAKERWYCSVTNVFEISSKSGHLGFSDQIRTCGKKRNTASPRKDLLCEITLES